MAGYFSKIFGDSPVAPIQEHGDTCFEAARTLIKLFEAAANSDWDGVQVARDKIVDFENKADELKRQIRSQLSTNVFMPVSREDLLDLVLLQDKIANRSRDISGLVVGRKMQIPAPIKDAVLTYVSRNVDAAKKARKTIRELDELYEAGFKGKEADLVESLVDELDEIENDTDQMQINIRGSLMEIEQTLNPIDVMFLYRVIEMVGDIADRAEVVGRRLEVLLNG
ncbi:MAG: TIGR00153 family protein [Pseudomonadota bacterium]